MKVDGKQLDASPFLRLLLESSGYLEHKGISPDGFGAVKGSAQYRDWAKDKWEETVLRDAAIVSAKATLRLLNQDAEQFQLKFIDDAQACEEYTASYNKEPEGHILGRFDPNSHTLCINSEAYAAYLETDPTKGIVDIAATTIHEVLHAFCGIRDTATNCGDVGRLQEGAIDYLAVKVLNEVAGISANQVEISEKPAFDFFEKLESVVGHQVIINSVMASGSLDGIGNSFDYLSPNIAFDELIAPRSNPSGGAELQGWEVAAADGGILDRIAAQLPAEQKPDLDEPLKIPGTMILLEESDTAYRMRAEELIAAVDTLNTIFPSLSFDLSPEIGIVAYAERDGLPRPVDVLYSHGWDQHDIGAVEGTGSHFDQVKAKKDSLSVECKQNHGTGQPEEQGITVRLVISKLSPKEEANRIATLRANKVATPPQSDFSEIMTIRAVTEYITLNWPPATDYQRSRLVKIVDLSLRLEKRFAFPSSPAEIARRINKQSHTYEDEYLVQPTIETLCEYISKQVAEQFGPNNAANNPFVKYSVQNFMEEVKDKLFPQLYRPEKHAQLLSYVARLDSSDKTEQAYKEQLFHAVPYLLEHLGIFRPTVGQAAYVLIMLTETIRINKLPHTRENVIALVRGYFAKFSNEFGLRQLEPDAETGLLKYTARNLTYPQKIEEAIKFLKSNANKTTNQ